MQSKPLISLAEPAMYSPDELDEYFGGLGAAVFVPSLEAERSSSNVSPRVTHLVVARSSLPESELGRYPLLRAIVKWGRGTERIDLPAATKRGILVAYTPYAIQGVAEAALLLMLALSKNLLRQIRAARGGQISDDLAGVELCGRSLGIIGFGAVGKALAAMAAGVGMRILAYTLERDRAVSLPYEVCFLSLDDLLVQSDFVSIHASATPEGQPILGARHLRMMKAGAYLINTARGSLIDEVALVEALKSGRLAGAGLDVVSDEPISPDHPLLQLENVIVTPHMLGFTEEAHRRIKQGVKETLVDLLEGRTPAYVANPELLPSPRREVVGESGRGPSQHGSD